MSSREPGAQLRAIFEESTDANAYPEDVARVMRGLRDSNFAQTGDREFLPYRVFVREPEGELIAGLLAVAFWGWLHIETIWVDESHRRRGVATRLIGMAEAFGTDRGCRFSLLDTFSFQARPLYESVGYEVVATLPAYLGHHERYFMVKQLPAGDAV